MDSELDAVCLVRGHGVTPFTISEYADPTALNWVDSFGPPPGVIRELKGVLHHYSTLRRLLPLAPTARETSAVRLTPSIVFEHNTATTPGSVYYAVPNALKIISLAQT